MSQGDHGSGLSESDAEDSAERKRANALIGRVLDGRYRIEAVLGMGGIGVVYRAEHTALRRPVAVKVLHDEFGGIDELRRRFEREAKVLSSLAHPNIVAITDYGVAGDMPYLAMELLEGRTLADLLDEEGISDPEVALEIGRSILRGLAFAHARSVLHRDLKPANVFLQRLPDDPFHVRLLDFGLAKLMGADNGKRAQEPTLTRLGTILGTPAYMSPEQASGAPVDVRADVYSAGVLLFEMLTGRQPFVASTRADLLRAHLVEPVPRLAEVRPGLVVVPELEQLITRSMAKDKTNRFADAHEMLSVLDGLPRPSALVAPQVEQAAAAAAPARPHANGQTSDSSVHEVQSRELLVQPTEVVPLAGKSWVRTLVLALFCAVVLAFVTVAVLAAMSSDGADSEVVSASSPRLPRGSGEAAAPAKQPAPAEVVADDPVQPVAAASRPAPRDPFARGVPRALRRLKARAGGDRALRKRDLRDLQSYQRTHPEDVRPILLRAYDHMNRGWFKDAIQKYLAAYAKDASSRGDRRMRRDLLRLMDNPAAQERAANAIQTIYGAEALADIERMLASPGLDPVGRGHLEALRDRLHR